MKKKEWDYENEELLKRRKAAIDFICMYRYYEFFDGDFKKYFVDDFDHLPLQEPVKHIRPIEDKLYYLENFKIIKAKKFK